MYQAQARYSIISLVVMTYIQWLRIKRIGCLSVSRTSMRGARPVLPSTARLTLSRRYVCWKTGMRQPKMVTCKDASFFTLYMFLVYIWNTHYSSDKVVFRIVSKGTICRFGGFFFDFYKKLESIFFLDISFCFIIITILH